MTARQPRFELVRSDAGWFARFVAANGQKVWQTEVYTRRAAVLRAVRLVTGGNLIDGRDGAFVQTLPHVGYSRLTVLEVREVDERTAP